MLFRGVGNKRKFCWHDLEHLSPDAERILGRYLDAHQQAFLDSEVSFQVARARVCRCETGFLHCDLSWTEVARELGFDQERGPLARWLRSVPLQSFTLLRRMAERKFGPNYVKCATPINNVRITSFFAGECEVTIIDPRRVRIETRRLGISTFACEQTAVNNDARWTLLCMKLLWQCPRIRHLRRAEYLQTMADPLVIPPSTMPRARDQREELGLPAHLITKSQ